MMMWSGWGYWLTAVGILLFWTALFIGVIAVIRYTDDTRRDGSDDAPQRNPAPRHLPALRYACGEIDDEEYARRSRMPESAG
ncbi:SHOCT domain-containing protein [Nocardia terpenica]|uniref:SHOCT domain-containing protein n=1 Tax=Nocardia terpenica TaxID=455432 RepID=A0A6G9Z024_9NOCA|nr:SHOCT domain-containing protein [Nocardia terpenica]QIS18949.1 hypothetical protein F6W96_12205 [Nocardia terpenica]